MSARFWPKLTDRYPSLERVADALRQDAFADPEDGRLVLELAIVEKLLGRIETAFSLLDRALDLLPASEAEARQTAQFVLGLTWGDVGKPARAVAAFEAAIQEDVSSQGATAAAGYAAAYRDVHGVR